MDTMEASMFIVCVCVCVCVHVHACTFVCIHAWGFPHSPDSVCRFMIFETPPPMGRCMGRWVKIQTNLDLIKIIDSV